MSKLLVGRQRNTLNVADRVCNSGKQRHLRDLLRDLSIVVQNNCVIPLAYAVFDPKYCLVFLLLRDDLLNKSDYRALASLIWACKAYDSDWLVVSRRSGDALLK